MKKTNVKIFFILSLGVFLAVLIKNQSYILNLLYNNYNKPNFVISYSKTDKNNNSIADPLDIVSGARIDIKNKTPYKSTYYIGGYPPNTEGVCTDVVWRAFKKLDINLKDLIDKDIAFNTTLYPRVNGNPNPNIDFRRVLNLDVFFKRHCESLTVKLDSNDINNLKQWHPGDIVIFLENYEHIAIISDKRDKDGIPYILHNSPPHATEVKLSSIQNPIHAHYRWKYNE